MQIVTKFIADNAVTNAKQAQMAARTIKVNYGSASANATDTAMGYVAYDAVVGSSGTHASINAVIADSNIANIHSVLVKDAATLNTTQTISVNDIEFVFSPGAAYTNGTAGTGLSITGSRVTIRGGRFLSFTTAISISSAAHNTLVWGSRFNTNTTGISDSGVNSTLDANIEEV